MLDDEKRISLIQAAALLPPGRGSQRVHPSTLARWIHRGVRAPDGKRVRLEALRCGARWTTSAEALRRFAQALTPHFSDEPLPIRTTGQRQRANERAKRELAERGI
jgi:hypothetical protein